MTDIAMPPGPQPQRRDLDFVRAFTFIFKDPEWVRKTLIGGLFVALSIVLVGLWIVMGYGARLARNVIAGRDVPLPEWDDIGGMLVEGLKLFLVSLAYVSPMILVYAAVMAAAVASGSSDAAQVMGVLSGCVMVAVIPLAIILLLLLPVALISVAVTGSMGAAFDLPEIFRFIRHNFVNYILAVVVYWVANFLAQIGFALLCVGLLFTTFLYYMISTWAFAESWRLDARKA